VRERALRQFAQRRGLIIEEPALRLLVDRTAPVSGQSALSVRDLEGMLTRVEAVQRVDVGDGAPNEGPVRIGALAVRRALGLGDNDALTPASAAMRRPLRAEQIIAHVCLTLGVERSDLASTTRHKRVVLARAIITHACRELTTMSFPEIARALGRPSHSTVITAQQRLARQIESGEVWGIGAGGEGVTIAALVREVIGGLVK
jgi:chromosomal replication initiator protein